MMMKDLAAAAAAARVAARAARAWAWARAGSDTTDWKGAFHVRSVAALARARAILAGEYAAEQYDTPLS